MRLNNFFKDSNGTSVVFQKPNVPLYMWIISSLLLQIEPLSADIFLQYLRTISIIIWALLELFSGASPFRKTAGLIVLSITAVGLYMS